MVMRKPAGWSAEVPLPDVFADISGTDWWESGRRRALADLELRQDRLNREMLWRGVDEFINGLRSIDLCREMVWEPDWRPQRPARRMPTVWKLVEYWAARPDVFQVRPQIPHCFGCGDEVPYDEAATPKERWNGASGYFERAHLVARVYDGLDGPQNIVPLCGLCHRMMPDDDGTAAIAWLQRGGYVAHVVGLTAGLIDEAVDH
jgi:hypothetical protein